MTASEIFEAMHQADLLQMLQELCKAIEKSPVIPTVVTTSCTTQRALSGAWRMKTYSRNIMGQERLNNIVINIEHSYCNKVTIFLVLQI